MLGGVPAKPGLDTEELFHRRLVAATFALLGVFAFGTLGLWSLGHSHLSKPWELGECAFFILITITTVGYGELPGLAEVQGGRAFTSVVLLAGAGVVVYFVSALTTYFVEGQFQQLRWRRRMNKKLDALSGHIIVCGVGTTGVHIVEELAATGWPLCAVDVDPYHLDRVQAYARGDAIPTVQGDATEDEVLERAGIRRAHGLVAALTDDKANLYIVVTARGLNPNLKIVAKGVDVKAAEKLRKAGADRVVNPAFIGAVRMVSEMIRPQVVEFLDQMLRDRDKTLRIEEVAVPPGSPFIDQPIAEAQIRRHTNLLVVAVREPDGNGGTGRFVYNPGADTRITEGMALIVLGEADAVQRLRRAIAKGFEALEA
jgi:voltage-gated potassium channel